MLGGLSNQPTDTSTEMRDGDALLQATSAGFVSLRTAMQDGSDTSFLDQDQARYDLIHNGIIDYSGAPMSDESSGLFGGIVTSQQYH